MHRLILLIAVAASAFAGDVDRPPGPTDTPPPGAPGGATGGMGPQFLIIAMIIAFMWFILIRPQRKEEKRRKEMMASIKRGDRVVTIGGLHCEVVSVGETTIDVRAGEGGREVVLTFNKGAVQSVPGGAAGAAEPAKGK